MDETISLIDWEALEFLTSEEVAAFLGVAANHVSTLASGGHIPLFRIGGHIRFERREIQAYREVVNSPALVPLARVRRARMRSIMMVERRLPFDVRNTRQNKFNFNSRHMPQSTAQNLKFAAPKTREPKQLLTVDEVAKQLKISKVSLTRLLQGGRIGFYKVGSRTRIDPADVEKYLASVRHEVWVR